MFVEPTESTGQPMREFKQYVDAKIVELESMPSHGEIVEGYPFDDTEFLDWCADVVRDVYIRGAAFGLDKEPPPRLLSRGDALYYLNSISAWADQQQVREAEWLTPEQAAAQLQVSKDSIYDLIKQGLLEHTKVGRLFRIKPESLAHIQQDGGW